MHLYFVTHSTDDRIFVTFTAGVAVEERTQAILWSKNALENYFALFELSQLLLGQAPKRVPKFRCFGTTTERNQDAEAEKHSDKNPAHFHLSLPSAKSACIGIYHLYFSENIDYSGCSHLLGVQHHTEVGWTSF